MASSGVGMGSPWGSSGGFPSLSGDQPLEVLRDVVLENLGLVVHAIPGHSQGVREERLDQAVVADHLQRDLLARRGERDSVVGLVADEPQLVEPLEHRGDGRGRHAQALGKRGGRDGPLLVALEAVDGLGVVLHGLGGRCALAFGEACLAGCPGMRHTEIPI